MRLYMYHCTNPACRHRYGFTLPEDPGMSPESYNKQHRVITKAIASGRYGEKLLYVLCPLAGKTAEGTIRKENKMIKARRF